jgi:cystathionine beta-lyase
MSLDFDTLIDRGIYPTQKLNTGDLQQHFGRADLLPFWIADMDLPAPPAVVEKLTQRAEHGIYGYEYRPDSFYAAMQEWYARRYGWSFDRAEIEQCPGALSALAILLDQHTDEGDGIIVQTPVFFEFRLVIRKNGRKMVKNPLRLVDGRYTIDFADLAQKAADPRNKMLVLCNPHNPVGRVWTRAELTRIAEICAANDVRVVADEIHGDIVYPPHQYTPYASLSPEAAAHSFTCLSPAKTFNVAGIADGIVVIPDEAARQRFNGFADRFQINRTNIFASAAAETAYREGRPGWMRFSTT